jgi:hypothetical protein
VENIKHITEELSTVLQNLHYQSGDMSDIGNEIGIVIAKYFNKNKLGFELEDFMTGLKHGISLTDGTHG